MSVDIGSILGDWPYEPGQVSVRRIRGDDGQEYIQLRLDLGLLQMRTEGRPDGQEPHGFESLLDYYRRRLDEHVREAGSEEGFTLDAKDCEMLRAEGVMYYHRYLAEFILEDYAAVRRDTQRNLAMMDFCAAHAAERADQYLLEQYRPYVLMMNARARAQLDLAGGRAKAARAAVQDGIAKIEDFYRRFGQRETAESSSEIAVLHALDKEIEGKIPADPVDRLKRALARAVAEERYEEAAVLRDQIRRAGYLAGPAASADPHSSGHP